MEYILTHTSLPPIRRWFAPGFVNYIKGCTRFVVASDKGYQLLPHGRWFSPSTPASSISKTGRHDIGEILLKAAQNTKNQIINSRLCIFLQGRPASKLLNPTMCEHFFFQSLFKCVRFGIVHYLVDQMHFCLKLHQVGSKPKDWTII